MNSLASVLERLTAAGDRLASTRERVEQREPWPVGSVGRGDGEAEWGATEVLAHLAEMLPYWLGEMERVVAVSEAAEDAPPAFGRTASDEIRRLTVVRDATLPARELYDRIEAALARYRRRLPGLTEEETRRHGHHPTRGDVTVTELLERFVAGHLEEHAEQLEGALAG